MNEQLTDLELGWLIGFLEGEGSFVMNRNCPMISVQNNDEDTMIKYASILEKITGHPYKVGMTFPENTTAIHQLAIYGDKAIKVMSLIISYMSERRQRKICEIIDARQAA